MGLIDTQGVSSKRELAPCGSVGVKDEDEEQAQETSGVLLISFRSNWILEIVKRVIRNKATHAYLSVEGNWVADVRCARDFEDTMAAFRAVHSLKVNDVELVLMMGQVPSATYDITLSISA